MRPLWLEGLDERGARVCVSGFGAGRLYSTGLNDPGTVVADSVLLAAQAKTQDTGSGAAGQGLRPNWPGLLVEAVDSPLPPCSLAWSGACKCIRRCSH